MGYFCAEAAAELGALINDWQQPEVRGVVLTGDDGRFITHYSVEELVAFGSDRVEMERIGTALSNGYHALLKSLSDLPKPVMAAITGDCMGGGFELAMWCDIRIAGLGDYRIGLPEILLDIMPGGSGTQQLASLVGPHLAREMILTGAILTPQRAFDRGLVHQVVDDPISTALNLAQCLANRNPRAIANIKLALAGTLSSVEPGLRIEAECFLDTLRSSESLSTMQTYLDIPEHDRRDWLEKRFLNSVTQSR